MASRRLEVVIAGDARGAKAAFGEVEDGATSFQSKLAAVGQKMQAFGGNMTRYVTLPIVAGLALATKAAIDEQQEIAKLNQVLVNSTVITDRQRQAVEKQITAWQNATGIADSKLRPAVSNLVVAGLSWEKTQKLMTIAMDIAAAKGVSVEAVTKAMARATQGNTTALSRMGVQVKDANGEMLTFDQILASASQTMGGSAARAANTAAGRMAILKARFADLIEQIGTTLIPIIERLVAGFGAILTKFQGLSPQMQKFIVVVALAAAALGPLLIVLGSLATALAAISLPVLAVGAAIAVLTAATILLYTHWDQVWSWMKDHPAIAALIILMTGPITIPIIAFVGLMRLMAGHWDEVWNGMKAVAQAVWPVLETIFAALDDAIRFFIGYNQWLIDNGAKAWTTFRDAVVDMWHVVDGPLGLLWDILKKIVDTAGKVAGAIGGIKSLAPDLTPGFDIPHVPGLASGGHVMETGLAVVHKGEDWSGVGSDRRWSPGGGDITVLVQLDEGVLVRAVAKRLNSDSRGGPILARAVVAN